MSHSQCIVCRRKQVWDPRDEPLSFFRFPKDTDQLKKWCRVLGTDIIRLVSIYSKICSDHFVDSDIYITPTGRKYLKKSAVPSLSLPSKNRCSIDDTQSCTNTHIWAKNQHQVYDSNKESVSYRSSTDGVHSPSKSDIKSENPHQTSNESSEKVFVQNVPISSDDRLIRKAHGVKRVRFDIPSEKENVLSSKPQMSSSSGQSHFGISPTEAGGAPIISSGCTVKNRSSTLNTIPSSNVKVIPVTPDQIQSLSNAPGVKLIPVTANQVQNMSSPGVLIAVPTGSSEAPIQILTPNSSAVINKVVISELQSRAIGVQNFGSSLSPDSLLTRAGQMSNLSKFHYILPKPSLVAVREAGPVDPFSRTEIDIKDECIDTMESLDIKSELDSEPDVDFDKGTDTSETLTASDTSETLTASETEEICAVMDKRSKRYGDEERPKERENRSSDANFKPRFKKARFFGDIKLEDLRTNYKLATYSWDIIQKTVRKHREFIDQISEENEELTKQITKIKNALRVLKEDGYVTSDNKLIMSPSWEAVVEEPKIIEPSPSGSSNIVAKKLSFWRIEKQD